MDDAIFLSGLEFIDKNQSENASAPEENTK